MKTKEFMSNVYGKYRSSYYSGNKNEKNNKQDNILLNNNNYNDFEKKFSQHPLKVYAKVQLISALGENLGDIDTKEAFKEAYDRGLDLVVLSENKNDGKVIVKIMDPSKKKYEEKKKQSQAKKKQHEIQVKELRLSAKIGNHDLEIKAKKAIDFLIGGDRVKIVMIFKGRERSLKDTFGLTVMNKLFGLIQEGISKTGRQLLCESETESPFAKTKIFFLKK